MPFPNCTLFMKANLSVVGPAVLLAASLSAAAVPPSGGASFGFSSADDAVGVLDGLYYSPAHPSLALEPQQPVESYPHVNPSLAGDLCEAESEKGGPDRVLRESRPLSVELAQGNREGDLRVFRAGASSLLGLGASFLFLACRRIG